MWDCLRPFAGDRSLLWIMTYDVPSETSRHGNAFLNTWKRRRYVSFFKRTVMFDTDPLEPGASSTAAFECSTFKRQLSATTISPGSLMYVFPLLPPV